MENLSALILATILLVLIPGPNAALIVANSLRHGFRFGALTAVGTTVGIGLQLILVVAGMAVLIEAAASALFWIKWLGVAYLLYLGVRSWRDPTTDLREIRPLPPSALRTFRSGMLLALINPKTLLFNAAFLPQFVAGGGNVFGELLLLTAVFLAVIVVGDTLWALFASTARRWLRQYGRIRNRLTGGFLFGAGLGLALSRRGI